MEFYFVWKLCFFVLGALTQFSVAAPNDYDFLLFAQQWPLTTCMQNGKQRNQCNIPHNDWTVHGIWPSKNAPARGPEECDRRNQLRVQNLANIRSQLERRWLNVLSNNAEGFWSWEWKKHGTCSLNLPALNSQNKYFNQGLTWNRNYVIGNILNNGGVRPGGSYTLQNIQAALRRGLNNVTPQISCFKSGNRQFLQEIRICISKNLQLINCAGHTSDTNCNRRSNIEYPA
ncbi:ribonuclease Oy-like [Leptopilina heterotoma]|uniref:ribonuclease Oy-like n=1 Tax=Leptopilina heterotoma TaxID=63436 RepID=UPI001CA9BDED|nr:ribonuclease Oy-like [Leptopilina heterotoma]